MFFFQSTWINTSDACQVERWPFPFLQKKSQGISSHILEISSMVASSSHIRNSLTARLGDLMALAQTRRPLLKEISFDSMRSAMSSLKCKSSGTWSKVGSNFLLLIVKRIPTITRLWTRMPTYMCSLSHQRGSKQFIVHLNIFEELKAS